MELILFLASIFMNKKLRKEGAEVNRFFYWFIRLKTCCSRPFFLQVS